MNAYLIEDIKRFTTLLFLKDTFDFFETGDVSIQTFTHFQISGTRNLAFYDSDERTLLSSHCTWNQLRPFCLQIIKGKRLPLSFKIVFFANNLSTLFSPSLQESISHCSMTILYKNGKLSCITGIAYSQFTLDRSAETLWDNTIEQFLQKQLIPFHKQ